MEGIFDEDAAFGSRADVPGGNVGTGVVRVCRDGECRRVACAADDECGAQAVCSEGACRAVECRNAGQCPSCSLWGSDNRCVSLCRDGEECFGFPAVEPGRFIVHL